ncbi:hypothetical protein ABIA31_004177 [Catenulispora sp. MAP5-51]
MSEDSGPEPGRAHHGGPEPGRSLPVGPEPGLCAMCSHVHRNETRKGTVYWRCTRAADDPRFPRYPRLPVLSCPGFEARAPE